MARYIGPKTKIARKFADPIFGPDKYFEKRKFPPGQHGPNSRRGKTDQRRVHRGDQTFVQKICKDT